MFRLCSILLLFCLAGPAAADVTGRVRVIDGDTIQVGDTRVRLHGVDAPEMGQPCQTDSGQTWDCGQWASDGVEALFGGRRAVCVPIELDRYGRTEAKCTVRGRDMGEVIVAEGYAFAFRRYSMDYDLTEKGAAVAGVGLWSMSLQAPAAYRNEATAPAPQGDCIIKGNISNSGRIYHMPHNADYARTRINEGRGERWFCTEAEARAAGWRPARN